MTPTDRASLERAIEWLYPKYPKDTPHPVHGSIVGLLLDLVNERIESLPKTKMVEVRRWVSFDHIYENCGDGEDAHLITRLRAFVGEQDGPGQWVTFKVEVPA